MGRVSGRMVKSETVLGGDRGFLALGGGEAGIVVVVVLV